MTNLITLTDLHAPSAQYYVYHRTKSNLSHIPHYHDYFQLCFLASGEICHSQGNDSVILHGGEAFIIPPGFVHKLDFINKDTQMYTIAFHESLFQADFLRSNAFKFLKDLQIYCDSGTVPLSLTLDANQCLTIQTLIKCLLQQQGITVPPELSAVPSLICSIVYFLAQCYYQNPQNKRQPWNSNDNAQLLHRCIAYVDTHYTEPLTPDALAKQFGLSRSVLCSAFQQRTGFPLHKYISQKRIQKAQILIRSHPELSINQVAGQVGYEDDSTFYRNFIKVTGHTPSGYKEHCHGKRKTN